MANELVLKNGLKATSVKTAELEVGDYALPIATGNEGDVLQVDSDGDLIFAPSTGGEDNSGTSGPTNITYTMSGVTNLFTIPANTRVTNIAIEIITPFTDANASVIVGDSVNTSRLMTVDESDLTAGTGNIFQANPIHVYGSATGIFLTLDPATSIAGSFTITLSYL